MSLPAAGDPLPPPGMFRGLWLLEVLQVAQVIGVLGGLPRGAPWSAPHRGAAPGGVNFFRAHHPGLVLCGDGEAVWLWPGGTLPLGVVAVGLGLGEGRAKGRGDVPVIAGVGIASAGEAVPPWVAFAWLLPAGCVVAGLECWCGNGSSGTCGRPAKPTPATRT